MKKLISAGIAAALAATAFCGTALAADIHAPEKAKAPVVKEALTPWQIRVRALGVVPRNSATVNQIPGSDMEFSRTVVPELDISYYFTENLAAELVLATTYSMIDAAGTLQKDGAGKLGKTWILPPTLMLQYHFTNFGKFKPYVGAGVNYTFFYNEDAGHNADGVGLSDLKVENEWGGALQVGFDYMLNEHWGFNFDVKKLYLQPDWHGRLNDATATALKITDPNISGKAKLDPWLIGAGVTYRF